MCSIFRKYQLFLIIIIIIIGSITHVQSNWTFAVTTKSKILFLNDTLDEVNSVAHKFTEIMAIEYDSTDNVIYFNDNKFEKGAVLSFQATDEDLDSPKIKTRITETRNTVEMMAYDPVDRMLYWTNWEHMTIFRKKLGDVDDKDYYDGEIFITFEDKKPIGIAIDICRRNLYFTNAVLGKASSIEIISLNASTISSQPLFTDVKSPHGIYVDQESQKLFWADDVPGDAYAIEYSNLDGSDRKTLISGHGKQPRDIVVHKSKVYWTDNQNNAICSLDLNADNLLIEKRFKNFSPKGIIVRDNYLKNNGNAACSRVMEMLAPTTTTTTVRPIVTPEATQELTEGTTDRLKATGRYESNSVRHCMNNGTFLPDTNQCKCSHEYIVGDYCENNLCHNYCLHNGECFISESGAATCKCRPGYDGDRCEYDTCHKHCFNGGKCVFKDKETSCYCGLYFNGTRCEHYNIAEICKADKSVAELSDLIDFDFVELCMKINESGEIGIKSTTSEYTNDAYPSCRGYNSTVLILVVGVLVALTLVLIIVVAFRRIHKSRPKIKKTFVVRKNMPLTSRPTTEQCEITIENCCNMNVCDTPCFDPKVLQQTGGDVDDCSSKFKKNSDRIVHDDRKKLLSDMEGNLDFY